MEGRAGKEGARKLAAPKGHPRTSVGLGRHGIEAEKYKVIPSALAAGCCGARRVGNKGRGLQGDGQGKRGVASVGEKCCVCLRAMHAQRQNTTAAAKRR